MYTIECPTWRAFKEHLLRYAALSRTVRDKFIFRGQRDSAWRLESSLDRQFAHLNVLDRTIKLKRLLEAFAEELSGIDGRDVIEESERLELIGRHHGLPTTVLDWSKSPYVASYFAFEDERAPASATTTFAPFSNEACSCDFRSGLLQRTRSPRAFGSTRSPIRSVYWH